jgi:Fic family protein
LLDRVRTHGDWETWLEFFLTGVKETAQQAADTSREILTLIEKDRRQIEELGRPAASVLRVHLHLQRKPIITIPATAGLITVPCCADHDTKNSMDVEYVRNGV